MAISAATGSGSGIDGISRIEAPRSSRVGISRGHYGGVGALEAEAPFAGEVSIKVGNFGGC